LFEHSGVSKESTLVCGGEEVKREIITENITAKDFQ
jgi:hypothetical protein